MAKKKKSNEQYIVADKIEKDCLFKICFGMITNGDIMTNKSGSDVSFMNSFREHFQDAFDHSDHLTDWWNKWQSRTDISDDDRCEFEGFEDDINMMCNIKDHLNKQNFIFQKGAKNDQASRK